LVAHHKTLDLDLEDLPVVLVQDLGAHLVVQVPLVGLVPFLILASQVGLDLVVLLVVQDLDLVDLSAVLVQVLVVPPALLVLD